MIKGFTPHLAEGGKIKIGGLGEARKSKSGNDFRLPVKLDHFLVTETERDSSTGNFRVRESVMERLEKDHDGLVREIPIVVHSDEIEEVFPTAYALYSGRRMQCRGDGETALRRNASGGTSAVACPCDQLGKTCKPHGTLHCSIRVPGQGLAGAVYKVRTTSEITIRRIIGSLIQIRQTVGVLRGLPLVLCLKPVDVNPNGVASTVYVLHIELREENLIEVQRQAIESAKMRATVMKAYDLDYKQLIQAPGLDEDDEEQDYLNQEFSPETVAPGEATVVSVESLTQKVREAGNAGAQNVREKLGMGQPPEPKQLAPSKMAASQPANVKPPTNDRVKAAFAWLGAKGLQEQVILGNIGRESLADVTDSDIETLRIAFKAIQGGGKPELALISAWWASKGVRDDELAQILGRMTIDQIDDHDREALIRAAKYDDPKRFLLGVVGAEEKEAG